MKFSDYLKEQHISTTRGTDDTYPELFMDWWGELELEDLDMLAEGWLEEREHKVSGKYEMSGAKETRENLSKLTIRKD